MKGIVISIGEEYLKIELNNEIIRLPIDNVSLDMPDKDLKKTKKKEKREDWLVKNIKIRVKSKKLKKGELYNKKGRVEDVVGKKAFIVFDNENYVEEVKEKYLEPYVKDDSKYIYILWGEAAKSIGEVLEYDSERKVFHYIMKGNREQVYKIGKSEVAEYN